MLLGRDERSFEVYADFLVELIKEKFITMELVNELSVGLYKHEWNKVCILFVQCVNMVFAFGRCIIMCERELKWLLKPICGC